MKAAGKRTWIIIIIPAFMANFTFIPKTRAKNNLLLIINYNPLVKSIKNFNLFKLALA